MRESNLMHVLHYRHLEVQTGLEVGALHLAELEEDRHLALVDGEDAQSRQDPESGQQNQQRLDVHQRVLPSGLSRERRESPLAPGVVVSSSAPNDRRSETAAPPLDWTI